MIASAHNDTHLLLMQVREEALAGNLSRALALLNHIQRSDPANAQGWSLAAALFADLRDWTELEHLARRWITHDPRSVEAWQTLSRAFFEVSRFDEAIAAFNKVLEFEPQHSAHWISAAKIATAAQQYDKALSFLERVQALVPDSAELSYAFCRVYYLTGDLGLAERYCLRTLELNPYAVPAFTTLGQLREGRLSDAEIAAINQLLAADGLHPEYRALLNFTLGDALDKSGRAEPAFLAWQEANAINQVISAQEGLRYDAAAFENEVNLLSDIFGEPLAIDWSERQATLPRPVFVVGMPRSCTTLVESILAAHSQVDGAGELPTLYDIYEELLQTARREGVQAARAQLAAKADTWRRRYLAAIPQNLRASIIVDKQPLNFRAIGLIRMLFPEAPIIYTRRDAMDVGFSIYRNNFSKNWPCAHSLSDIGHYYGVHTRIMAYWFELHGECVHVVDHAKLITDGDNVIRHLLAFAGLQFEDACLAPHESKRAIATFSAVQVRQPVSGAYAGKSRAYTRQLAPLREALSKVGLVEQEPL
jgi:tetratricopeptide (TPR) repeat protein